MSGKRVHAELPFVAKMFFEVVFDLLLETALQHVKKTTKRTTPSVVLARGVG